VDGRAVKNTGWGLDLLRKALSLVVEEPNESIEMKIEQVFEEYPVMYALAHALEVARAAEIEQWGGVSDREDGHDETNDYFFLINEKVVNDTLDMLQNRLCEPAWRIIRDCDDYHGIRLELGDSDAWANDAEHAIKLVCLYGACLRMNKKLVEEAHLSAHELISIRAKEAAFLAKANAGEFHASVIGPLWEHAI